MSEERREKNRHVIISVVEIDKKRKEKREKSYDNNEIIALKFEYLQTSCLYHMMIFFFIYSLSLICIICTPRSLSFLFSFSFFYKPFSSFITLSLRKKYTFLYLMSSISQQHQIYSPSSMVPGVGVGVGGTNMNMSKLLQV